MSKGGKAPLKEADITKQIRDLLDALGIFHWKVWQGMMSKHGVADIVGCYKGRFFAIEVKRPGRSPTEEQAKFLNQVSRAGGIALTAWCVEHVIAALDLPIEL